MSSFSRRAAGGCVVVLAGLALVAPGVARADVVRDWNATAATHIGLIEATPQGQAPSFAMVQGAVYDAVNAIDRGHRPYLIDVEAVGAQPWVSQQAAAATAAHHVLVSLVPPAQDLVLDGLYAETLGAVRVLEDDDLVDAGIAAGVAAANAMIAARVGDGRGAAFTFTFGTQPGDWRPQLDPAGQPVLDPDPWAGNVKPFLIESPDQFRTKGPDALRSKAYAKDFAEVKQVGALHSTTRTSDQTTAAIFWQASAMALWNSVFRDIASSQHLNLVDGARLLAMVDLAAADGAIGCWNDKYHWNFWRPIAAIREAATDGNPDTVADTTWKPLFDPSTPTVPAGSLSTPAFPDHPSGHSCVSAAILHTAQDFFGTDDIGFDVQSSRFPGQPRHYAGFSDALEEIIDARVWGGIHFRNADEQGALLGKRVAHWSDKHYFQRTR